MNVLKKLNDPNLTAKFQQYCGVSSKNVESCDECQNHAQERDNEELKTGDRCANCRVKAPWSNTRHALLFYLFSYSSSLGNEVFYLLFYPYCVWNVDSLLIRRTALVWSLCMYVGQAGKDLLWWPRPASPPVIRLETEFLQESSMPSTHAASATAIPFMLAYYLCDRYQVCTDFECAFNSHIYICKHVLILRNLHVFIQVRGGGTQSFYVSLI